MINIIKARQLTTELHDLTCTLSHIDQCGWGYHDFDTDITYNTKNAWLEEVLKNYDACERILVHLKELKKIKDGLRTRYISCRLGY